MKIKKCWITKLSVKILLSTKAFKAKRLKTDKTSKNESIDADNDAEINVAKKYQKIWFLRELKLLALKVNFLLTVKL